MSTTTLQSLARPEVLPLPAYNAGLSSAAVRARYGVTDIARLASNENPYGPSPTVARALVDLAAQAGNYPDVIHLATGREKALTETFIKDNNLVDITDVLSMTVPGESAKVSDKIAGGFTDTSLTNPYGDGKACERIIHAILRKNGFDVENLPEFASKA